MRRRAQRRARPNASPAVTSFRESREPARIPSLPFNPARLGAGPFHSLLIRGLSRTSRATEAARRSIHEREFVGQQQHLREFLPAAERRDRFRRRIEVLLRIPRPRRHAAFGRERQVRRPGEAVGIGIRPRLHDKISQWLGIKKIASH